MINTAYAVSGFSTHTQSQQVFTEAMEFGDFILLAISLMVLFASIFSIAFILRGGLLLILSGGKDEKIKPAINSIRYALLGLVLIVISIFIFPKLGDLLGLDVDKYFSPDRIFMTIQDLGNKIFGTSNDISGVDSINQDGLPDSFIDDL